MGPQVARPGTIPYRAIKYLQSLPAGSERSSAELAEALGQPSSGFGQYLNAAAQRGLLSRRLTDAGVAQWRLGDVSLADDAEAQKRPAPLPDPDEDLAPRQRTVLASAAPSIFAFAADRGAADFSAAAATDGRVLFERRGRTVLELTAAEAAIARRALGIAL